MPIRQTSAKSVRLATPCRLWYRSGVVRARAPGWAPGKAVRIRRDPVTVIGDETRESHWPRGREGAGSRTIREPGDLPARAPCDSGLRGRTWAWFRRLSFLAVHAAARAASLSSC